MERVRIRYEVEYSDRVKLLQRMGEMFKDRCNEWTYECSGKGCISILFMGNDASHDALSFFCDAAMVEGITPPEAERERLKPTFDRVSETHTNSCTVADK